jgi:hypothetical protein
MTLAYLVAHFGRITSREDFEISLQGTCLNTPVILLPLHLLTEEYIVLESGVLDPGLLWNISNRTLELS